jgi:hypothetical protein
MKVTLDIIREKFDLFNDSYFNSELPRIDFKITKEKRRFGFFEYARRYDAFTHKYIEVPIRIGISSYYDMPEKSFDETLIHEMIHYYIAHKRIKDNNKHGRYFMMYASRISAASGYDITRYGNSSGMALNNDGAKKDYFIMKFKYRGTQYFSRISRSRVGTSDEIKSAFNGVTNISFYKSNDVKLDRYRQCTARLSLNPIDALDGIKLKKIA